jgi:uncharacterized protein (TIGR02996 family)
VSDFPTLPAGELRAFLAAVHDTPEDDGPRLVFADWLDDHGDPRGEFLRLEVERARTPEEDSRAAYLFRRSLAWRATWQDCWLGPAHGGLVRLVRGLPEVDLSLRDGSELRRLPTRLRDAVHGGWVSDVRVRLHGFRPLRILADWLGPPPLASPVRVATAGQPVLDTDLAALAALSPAGLDVVDGRRVTDSGLTALARAGSLRELLLWHAGRVTEAGFAALTTLPDLRVLGVGWCPGLSPSAAEAVARMPSMRRLVAHYCPRLSQADLERAAAGRPWLRTSWAGPPGG